MRENSSAMTLVMTVILAISVSLSPSLPFSKESGTPSGILNLPWKATFSTETDKDETVKETAVEETLLSDEEENAEAEARSMKVLASRSGNPLAPVQTEPKPEVQEEQPKATTYSDEDLYWMSRVISAEAKGESLEGQIAVGAVVMNRLKSNWSKTVKGVIFAQGQFDPVRNGTIYNDPVPSAVEAAKRALAGENPVPGALYFYNPQIASDPWIRTLRVTKVIGNHVFAAK